MSKPIVFSGIQPSGELTIGNYLGALKNWRIMQDDSDCNFCIVDMHAITNKSNLYSLSSISLDILSIILSCGIDPEKSTIFLQSHVPEHSQLNWILNCYSYFGEISRMTQLKHKSINRKHINIGLLDYPVLMAADILLYKSNQVPVGDDQKQHLELTCNIAKRFNNLYGNIFTIPKAIISIIGSRIMSLLEPTKKMSKSDKNRKNVIYLLEKEDTLVKKIKKATTDSDHPPAIYYDPIHKPGISNLLSIISGISNISISELEKNFVGKQYSYLKNQVIEIILDLLYKIKNNFLYFRKNEDFLKKILSVGAEKAQNKAKITLNQVYESIGFFS